MTRARRTALAGVVVAAVLEACLLVPGMRLGVERPWLGAVILVVPTVAVLTATGYRHYGFTRAVEVALVVSLVTAGVSWIVAVFTLVKALSGAGMGPAWAILLFLTPVVSVLALGMLALRSVEAPRPG